MQLSRLLWVACVCVPLACAAPSRNPTAPAGAFELTLPALNGAALDLSTMRGRVVLIDLWATWCKPCEESFPFYGELYSKHREQGLVIWAVSVDKEDSDVRAFLERRPAPFQILRDPAGSLPERLGVKAMPTALLVGRDGAVVWTHAGFESGDQAEIEKQVLAALAQGAGPGEAPRGESP